MKHKFKFRTFEFSTNHYECKNCGKTIVSISPKDYREQVIIANEETSCGSEDLANRMCGYSTGTVAEAIIEYFKRPDCSKATRKKIFKYLK